MEDKTKKVTQAIVDVLVQNNLSLRESQSILGQLYQDLAEYTVLTSSRQESEERPLSVILRNSCAK